MNTTAVELLNASSEQNVREDLAAAYRLLAMLKMDDGIFTHISARIPGEHDHFLINPFGFLFGEVTASSLVKVDINGSIADSSSYEINRAGFTIHSAIHNARPDALCVMHTHTIAGVSVSSLAAGLQPVNQWALQFYNRVVYHEFEGLALDLDERERLIQSLGPECKALILRNHGLLTIGRTIAEAFVLMRNLERACRVQLAIQSSGQPVRHVPAEICERTARQYESGGSDRNQKDSVSRQWEAFRRLLDTSTGKGYYE